MQLSLLSLSGAREKKFPLFLGELAWLAAFHGSRNLVGVSTGVNSVVLFLARTRTNQGCTRKAAWCENRTVESWYPLSIEQQGD